MADRKTQETVKYMQDAKRLYEEGIALLEVNPVKGRDALLLAKETIENAVPLQGHAQRTCDSTKLAKQIDEAILGASHTYTVERRFL